VFLEEVLDAVLLTQHAAEAFDQIKATETTLLNQFLLNVYGPGEDRELVLLCDVFAAHNLIGVCPIQRLHQVVHQHLLHVQLRLVVQRLYFASLLVDFVLLSLEFI